MPRIPYPQLQAVVDHFEALVASCEEYRDFLERQRPRPYQGQAPGGTIAHGRFHADPVEVLPAIGTREFQEFAYNRHLVKNAARTQALIDLLDGEGFDRLRQMIDGTGTLESARKGEWF